MALLQYNDSTMRIQVEESTKASVKKLANSYNCLYCYTNKEPENDYNIPLGTDDWNILQESLRNPKNNDKLSNALNRKLMFD